MPGAEWFPGATLNYAIEAFRHETDERPGAVVVGEDGSTEWSWARLRQETAGVRGLSAQARCQAGGPGRRVPAEHRRGGRRRSSGRPASARPGRCATRISPSTAWSPGSGSWSRPCWWPATGRCTAASASTAASELAEIRRALPTLKATVLVPRLGREPARRTPRRGRRCSNSMRRWRSRRCRSPTRCGCCSRRAPPARRRASCTATVACVLEHLKYLSLQADLKPGDRFLWYSTTSWMMWNLLVGGLLVGATDRAATTAARPTRRPTASGRWSPTTRSRCSAPAPATSWAAPRTSCTRARSISSTRCARSARPVRRCPPRDSAGSRREWAGRVPVMSMSGGTDVVTAFIGGCPLVPIVAGELNVHLPGRRRRGVDRREHAGRRRSGRAGDHQADAVDAGVLLERRRRQPLSRRVLRQVPGRLVSRRLDHHHRPGFRCGARPFGRHAEPDGCPDGQRRDLQRGRVAWPRCRTAWWSASNRTTAATGCRCSSHLADDAELDDELRSKIVAAIRNGASPRHVPDDILEVPGIPRTLTGKRLEIPIKRILLGAKPADVVSPSAVDKPDLLAVFAEHARA